MTTTAGPTSEIPQIPHPAEDAAPVATPAAAPETSSVEAGSPAGRTKRAPRSKSAVKTVERSPRVTSSRQSARTPARFLTRKKAHVSPASAGIVIGGMPKVDLLPESIRVLDRQKRARRAMRFAALGLAIVSFVGTGAAWYVSVTVQQELAEAQANSLSLLQQQSQYSDLVDIRQQIDLTAAAQQVGGATDVDWRGYLATLQATLPAGVVITTVSIDAATPGASYAQSTTPLEGARVATLGFSAISPTLPDVPNWLDGLRTLPAFVDATPNSVELDDTTNTYVVDITMHVSSDIYSHRFTPTEEDAQ